MTQPIVQEFRTEVITAPDGDPAIRMLTDEQLIDRLAVEVMRLRSLIRGVQMDDGWHGEGCGCTLCAFVGPPPQSGDPRSES